MNDRTELVLVIGDLFIPQRISEIPEEIKKILLPNKFQHILCTGNVGSRETYDWLKSLCPNVNCVKGEVDDIFKFNETTVAKVGEFKIGLINGYQVMPWLDKDTLIDKKTGLNCDMLITGYSHKLSVMNYEGHYILNPGSLTGAYSSLNSEPNPSFMLLLIQGDLCVVYSYEMDTSTKNFEIMKYEFNRVRYDQA